MMKYVIACTVGLLLVMGFGFQASADNPQPQTVVVYPMIFVNGTDGAHDISVKYLHSILTKTYLVQIPEDKATFTWVKVMHNDPPTSKSGMPPNKELLKLGVKLNADWVIAVRERWHTRSIWVGFGPKTKSDCYVDMKIIHVRNAEIVRDAKNIDGNDTARDDPLKDAGAILLTPFITTVSGGPKTPHEQKAAVNAIGKAISPWVKTMSQTKKIE
jgi:hypothetical protein